MKSILSEDMLDGRDHARVARNHPGHPATSPCSASVARSLPFTRSWMPAGNTAWTKPCFSTTSNARSDRRKILRNQSFFARPSANMNSLCGSTRVTFCLPLLTRPLASQALNRRLTVWSVVPVISAMSCREIGKSIRTPSAGFFSRLIGESQQGMGDPLLDLLRRHFDDAGVRFLKARSDRLVSAGAECRIPRRKFRP